MRSMPRLLCLELWRQLLRDFRRPLSLLLLHVVIPAVVSYIAISLSGMSYDIQFHYTDSHIVAERTYDNGEASTQGIAIYFNGAASDEQLLKNATSVLTNLKFFKDFDKLRESVGNGIVTDVAMVTRFDVAGSKLDYTLMNREWFLTNRLFPSTGPYVTPRFSVRRPKHTRSVELLQRIVDGIFLQATGKVTAWESYATRKSPEYTAAPQLNKRTHGFFVAYALANNAHLFFLITQRVNDVAHDRNGNSKDHLRTLGVSTMLYFFVQWIVSFVKIYINSLIVMAVPVIMTGATNPVNISMSLIFYSAAAASFTCLMSAVCLKKRFFQYGLLTVWALMQFSLINETDTPYDGLKGFLYSSNFVTAWYFYVMDLAVAAMTGHASAFPSFWNRYFGGGQSVIMMVLDAVWMFFIAIYADKVVAGDWTGKKAPWFIFTFWKKREAPEKRKDKTFIEECAKPAEKVLVSVDGISHYRDGRWALQHVNCKAYSGEILSVYGHEDSGRSTLLHVINKSTRPTCGDVTIKDGCEVSYMPADVHLFDHMTVEGHLKWYIKMRNPRIDADEKEKWINDTLGELRLDEKRKALAHTLSPFGKRRLMLAIAFCGAPDVVCLDQPTKGLDRMQSKLMQRFIYSMRSPTRCMVVATGDYNEAEQLGDSVVLLAGGAVMAWGGLQYMHTNLNTGIIITITADPTAADKKAALIKKMAADMGKVETITCYNDTIRFLVPMTCRDKLAAMMNELSIPEEMVKYGCKFVEVQRTKLCNLYQELKTAPVPTEADVTKAMTTLKEHYITYDPLVPRSVAALFFKKLTFYKSMYSSLIVSALLALLCTSLFYSVFHISNAHTDALKFTPDDLIDYTFVSDWASVKTVYGPSNVEAAAANEMKSEQSKWFNYDLPPVTGVWEKDETMTLFNLEYGRLRAANVLANTHLGKKDAISVTLESLSHERWESAGVFGWDKGEDEMLRIGAIHGLSLKQEHRVILSSLPAIFVSAVFLSTFFAHASQFPAAEAATGALTMQCQFGMSLVTFWIVNAVIDFIPFLIISTLVTSISMAILGGSFMGMSIALVALLTMYWSMIPIVYLFAISSKSHKKAFIAVLFYSLLFSLMPLIGLFATTEYSFHLQEWYRTYLVSLSYLCPTLPASIVVGASLRVEDPFSSCMLLILSSFVHIWVWILLLLWHNDRPRRIAAGMFFSLREKLAVDPDSPAPPEDNLLDGKKKFISQRVDENLGKDAGPIRPLPSQKKKEAPPSSNGGKKDEKKEKDKKDDKKKDEKKKDEKKKEQAPKMEDHFPEMKITDISPFDIPLPGLIAGMSKPKALAMQERSTRGQEIEKEEAARRQLDEAARALEQAKMDKAIKDQLEKEAKEAKDKEEKERLEKEIAAQLAREQADKEERERLEKAIADQLNKEQMDKEERELLEKAIQEQLNKEKEEKEKQEKELAEKLQKEKEEQEKKEKERKAAEEKRIAEEKKKAEDDDPFKDIKDVDFKKVNHLPLRNRLGFLVKQQGQKTPTGASPAAHTPVGGAKTGKTTGKAPPTKAPPPPPAKTGVVGALRKAASVKKPAASAVPSAAPTPAPAAAISAVPPSAPPTTTDKDKDRKPAGMDARMHAGGGADDPISNLNTVNIQLLLEKEKQAIAKKKDDKGKDKKDEKKEEKKEASKPLESKSKDSLAPTDTGGATMLLDIDKKIAEEMAAIQKKKGITIEDNATSVYNVQKKIEAEVAEKNKKTDEKIQTEATAMDDPLSMTNIQKKIEEELAAIEAKKKKKDDAKSVEVKKSETKPASGEKPVEKQSKVKTAPSEQKPEKKSATPGLPIPPPPLPIKKDEKKEEPKKMTAPKKEPNVTATATKETVVSREPSKSQQPAKDKDRDDKGYVPLAAGLADEQKSQQDSAELDLMKQLEKEMKAINEKKNKGNIDFATAAKKMIEENRAREAKEKEKVKEKEKEEKKKEPAKEEPKKEDKKDEAKPDDKDEPELKSLIDVEVAAAAATTPIPIQPIRPIALTDPVITPTQKRDMLKVPLLEMDSVEHLVGRRYLLHEFNLTLRDGSFTSVFTPDRAAASSLLDMVAGRRWPSDGGVTVADKDNTDINIGYVPRQSAHSAYMTPTQQIKFCCIAQGHEKSSVDTLTEALLTLCALKQAAHTPIHTLSGSEQCLVSLACALSGLPHLLLLDNPTAAMCPSLAAHTWKLLSLVYTTWAPAVLLASANAAECETLGRDMALMVRGMVVAHHTINDIKAKYSRMCVLSIRFKEGTEWKDALPTLAAGLINAEERPSGSPREAIIYLYTSPLASIADLIQAITSTMEKVAHEWYSVCTTPLEDLYAKNFEGRQ